MKNKKIKSKNKIKFKFQAQQANNSKITGYINGYDKEEIKNFLENEGLKKVKVSPLNSVLYAQIGNEKFKYSSLAFILTQLATYLKAGIPLVDAMRILEKQATKAFDKRIFYNIIFELVKGESFSNSLEAQKDVFPRLLISMVKSSEKTGDLESVLDNMSYYYASIDKTKKQIVSSLTYPLIILLFSLVVIIFMLVYIVPSFIELFTKNNAAIPSITKFVIGISNFLTNNFFIVLFSIIIIIILFKLLYKHNKLFRKNIQILLMKLPIVGKVMIYKEVSMFTRTFSSLLEHKIFITDTMETLKDITNNVVYEEIIKECLEYLSKGAKISDAFKGKWAFPIVAYEMIVTGENTGKLELMMKYVSEYYDELYQNNLKRINTFIEPILIVLLSVVVGAVVLSVVIPMFSFYSQIG